MPAVETVIHSTNGNPAILVVPNPETGGWTLQQNGDRITLSDREMDALIQHVRSQVRGTVTTPAKARLQRFLAYP